MQYSLLLTAFERNSDERISNLTKSAVYSQLKYRRRRLDKLNHILKIALVQMFSEKGAIEHNLTETSRHIEEAEKRGIDIIAFPEASITGYHEPARFPHAVITQDRRRWLSS